MKTKKRRTFTRMRHCADWQARKEEASASEPDVRRALAAEGLALRVSTVRSGRTSFPHWLVYAAGRQVLQFWPTRGTWRCPLNEEKGTLDPPGEVVALAVRLARAAVHRRGNPVGAKGPRRGRRGTP
jgi:hypothetical protein